jgi:hypothetical protein
VVHALLSSKGRGWKTPIILSRLSIVRSVVVVGVDRGMARRHHVAPVVVHALLSSMLTGMYIGPVAGSRVDRALVLVIDDGRLVGAGRVIAGVVGVLVVVVASAALMQPAPPWPPCPLLLLMLLALLDDAAPPDPVSEVSGAPAQLAMRAPSSAPPAPQNRKNRNLTTSMVTHPLRGALQQSFFVPRIAR